MNENTSPTATQETLIEFPCDFPIKVMGKSCSRFEATILELVKPHDPAISEEQLSTRSSGQGNYMAVTVIIKATSKQQLDNIYLALNACDDVIMTI